MAAEAAVSFAVETLGKLLIEKAIFLKSVKEEVEWLRAELKSMQSFLKDAAKKQSENESIRKWISDVREVAHEAEDAIEMFVLNVQGKSLKERYGCFPNHLYHLYKVGVQIASIRQTLKDIQDRRARYGIQEAEPSTRTRSDEEIETRRRLAYWKPDQHVVGLEEDVKLLLGNAVFDKRKEFSVAAILGMGGIGKSTLASKIYNHAEVVGRFDFRSWVVVSSEFTTEDIMKRILLQLGISLDGLKRVESIDDKLGRQEELKKKLHECLTGKRYFIVLDDVWEAAHWESFATAFPDGDNGSRLLLTSRNSIITMNSGYVHNMKALDAIESWDLFMKKAFGGSTSIDECPNELRKIGEEILKKCSGLPLAISVVGGLLAKKTRSKSEWEKVIKEMNSHLGRSSGDLNSIASILELSYQNLPFELKACFLCLGFFKEDASIEAEELVHIWVAQGLVTQEFVREEEMKEDVARYYLNELISRNMVQVKVIEYDEVKSCHVHDLLRDLSIKKAKEEIDFEVLREEHNSQQLVFHKYRHCAVYCSEIRSVYSTNRNKHLRSLFIHVQDPLVIRDGPSSYWKSFELLRILYLGGAMFYVLPNGIGELTGLRYLKMKYDGEATRLPRSWGKLKNLEVLDLRRLFVVGDIKIDKVVLKMERLRHLYANVHSCKVGLGNMRNLQTLHLSGPRLSPSLHLEGLASLQRVTRLTLSGVLPLDFPPNLSRLTLINMRLAKDAMPVLEKLPALLYLKMLGVDIDDGIMVITGGGFPSLKLLHLEYFRNVCKMEIEESAMPELHQVILRDCENLDFQNLPDRIASTIVQDY